MMRNFYLPMDECSTREEADLVVYFMSYLFPEKFGWLRHYIDWMR